MTSMKTRIIPIFMLLTLVFGLSGCVDELLRPEDEFGDGESIISAEAVFQNFSGTDLGNTRSPGDTLGIINTLDVFIFKPNGELIAHYPIPKGNWTTENNSGRPDNKGTTEDPTMRVRFTLPVPLHYGRYKMYAVANVSASKLQDVANIDDLLNIQLTWNPGDILANNQMLGFFDSSERNGNVNYDSFAAPSIAIKAPNTTLYAWVRRAASKVTVAYDGRDLLDNVYIYLKSVTVHNVNKTAYLGKNSKANSAADVYEEGETEYYYDRETYPDGPPKSAFGPDWKNRIMKGTYQNSFKGSDHSDEANALFFFENMQGKGESKKQDADDNGDIDSPNSNDPDDPDWRDKMPNGTYIEVKAHYVSNIPGHMGNAPITYRFMLGQNIDDNYDVMRNCHYKVTLHFNKYANDVDWHIEYYIPTPSIDAPNPYYISYLYDKSIGIGETIGMPVQVNGEIEPNSQIQARILTNDWFPTDAPATVYYTGAPSSEKPWNGFLSLRNTGNITNIQTVDGGKYNNASTGNRDYYNDKKRGWRNYDTKIQKYPDSTDGTYEVLANDDGKPGVTLLMPMYTRAKILITTTGFTGNNPFDAYCRKATVEIKASLKNPVSEKYEEYKDTVTVYQVRRTVNPKGIWRKYDSDENFHVVLTHLQSQTPPILEDAKGNFSPFVSEGPWYAEVIGPNSSWVELSEAGESEKIGNRIYGETGSLIEFNYKPDKPLTDPNAVRCAMIRIRYHNFSCEHVIFVRQGYAPLSIMAGTPYWYSFNMRNQTTRAESPVEEGSMFRWANWSDAINAPNNRREGYRFGQNITNKNLWIYPTTSGDGEKIWSKISPDINANIWTDATIDNISARVADGADFASLRNKDNIQYAYGVLYADGSSEVQFPVQDAYGYYYDQPTGGNGQNKGMRGVFIYNEITGAQIFFPIGASGYGHRKGSGISGSNDAGGTLRYAGRSEEYPTGAELNLRPLFWRLFESPGAIYWCRTSATPSAWDFNYWTYDYNTYNQDAWAPGKSESYCSGCFIRCVRDTPLSVRGKSSAKRKSSSKLKRKFRK